MLLKIRILYQNKLKPVMNLVKMIHKLKIEPRPAEQYKPDAKITDKVSNLNH